MTLACLVGVSSSLRYMIVEVPHDMLHLNVEGQRFDAVLEDQKKIYLWLFLWHGDMRIISMQDIAFVVAAKLRLHLKGKVLLIIPRSIIESN